MINSVASQNEVASASIVAPARFSANTSSSAELQSRKALPTKQAPLPAEPESAVVEISSEGARRAQAAPAQAAPIQATAVPVAQVRPEPLPGPLPPSNSGADPTGRKPRVVEASPDRSETPISLPPDTPAPAAQLATSATGNSAAAVQSSGVAPTDQGLSSAQFEDADTNQDGTIDVMERKIYDFSYPTLDGKASSAAESSLEASRRQNLAELRAYEAVARSGRNL
ncbi:hypothetical protein C1O66_21580 [Paucibacter aquatile]|uniref:Uncharacterized protein n=1 Tax=Kinneretia aquatilis TaxID=2070761 RepID=A0A2N8KS51_9BURK|nr:hypothetical protein [Paucibacter aquatile]PND36298.1 hypothetical protein C1O66_21580 [Paucibacter aquatile]